MKWSLAEAAGAAKETKCYFSFSSAHISPQPNFSLKNLFFLFQLLRFSVLNIFFLSFFRSFSCCWCCCSRTESEEKFYAKIYNQFCCYAKGKKKTGQNHCCSWVLWVVVKAVSVRSYLLVYTGNQEFELKTKTINVK